MDIMGEYINPIDNVIKFLESERHRRIDALNSNQHCDNGTLKRNIEVLNCGIDAMKKQRELDKLNGYV